MVFLILPPCEKNSWLAYSNKSCFASLILISLTYHLRYRRAEMMRGYAEVRDCRREYLLNYFALRVLRQLQSWLGRRKG
jgi:hypothetical protein